MKVSEVFSLIVDLALCLDAAPLNKFPGCWEHRLGERWLIAMNGHKEPMKTSSGFDVPRGHAYVECLEGGGWPAMLLTPFDGITLGDDIEDELIADLKAAVHGPVGSET